MSTNTISAVKYKTLLSTLWYAILGPSKRFLIIGTLSHATAYSLRLFFRDALPIDRTCSLQLVSWSMTMLIYLTPHFAVKVTFHFATMSQGHLRSTVNMVISPDKTTDVSHLEHRNDGEITVKAVQNVALADANSKQQPSLFTRRMLMVCSIIVPDYETS